MDVYTCTSSSSILSYSVGARLHLLSSEVTGSLGLRLWSALLDNNHIDNTDNNNNATSTATTTAAAAAAAATATTNRNSH